MATANSIQGNYIGPDVRGLSALPNKLCGVLIQSPGNTVGGVASGAGNLISGNGQDGIFLDGARRGEQCRAGQFYRDYCQRNQWLWKTAGRASASPKRRAIPSGEPTAGAGNLISGNGSNGDQRAFTSLAAAPPET